MLRLSATFAPSVRPCYGSLALSGAFHHVCLPILFVPQRRDYCRPELIHPFASAIDSLLEEPSELVRPCMRRV